MSVRIIVGDSRDILTRLGDQSVNCCVTSPPYFGLRDYGADGQMGLEPTPDEYVAGMVELFREVRRVLRDDGTLWLNLGDSYASFRDAKCSPQTVGGGQRSMPTGGAANRSSATFRNTPIKHKDLIGIPWRVAFALQADGWYLRQDIIWSKPNPMPESVRDRCTKAHEYIFLLSKSPRYYYDYMSIKEKAVGTNPGNTKPTKAGRESLKGAKMHRTAANLHNIKAVEKRNRRSVWTVTTKPFRGAHFATFPPDLIEPCILAGCPENGTVLDPFGGAGTTGLVACELNRKAILCELNPEYVKMSRDRIGDASIEYDL